MIPDINIEQEKDYAALIADNFDSLQECFSTSIPEKNIKRIADAQEMAREHGDFTFQKFGNEDFQVWGGGSQGNKYVLESETLQIHIRTEKPGWNISVRYRASGLWMYGVDEMRSRARACVEELARPLLENGRWISLSWVHYCFDFYSPRYSLQSQSLLVAENMALASGVKAGIVFTSKKVETLTIGMNRAGVQIQVYNKGQEIKDKPGKEWFYEIWEENGFYPPEEDIGEHVWRVELRFGKEFLKDRNIRCFEDFQQKMDKLMAEALFRRRMVKPTGTETRKDRWALHPLWASVYAAAGSAGEYVPAGRILTGARLERADQLKKQIMGTIRALEVMENHTYKRSRVDKKMPDMIRDIEFDPEHETKENRCIKRYMFLDEGQ